MFLSACLEKGLIQKNWDGMYMAINGHGYYLGFFPTYLGRAVKVRIVWTTLVISVEDFIEKYGKIYPEIARLAIFHLDEFVQTK